MLAAKGLIELAPARRHARPAVRHWNRLDPDMLSWMGAIDPDLEFVQAD